MRRSTEQRSRAEVEPAAGYLAWSRDPAVGLFTVLPLWLLYEFLRAFLLLDERNGAEVLISEVVRLVGPTAFLVLRIAFGVLVVGCALAIHRRGIPWLRVAMVTALEGSVYALILGPLAAALAVSSERLLRIGPLRPTLVSDLVGSLGAGIFEELVFRLVLMSLLTLLLVRVAQAWGMPRVLGLVAAILLSALVFSLFHHVGPGAAPFTQRAFVFRTFAGVLLGSLFALRGFGVCVYCHALYDVHYYLTA